MKTELAVTTRIRVVTISMRMLNICNGSICKPLVIIFRSFLEKGKFFWEREKNYFF